MRPTIRLTDPPDTAFRDAVLNPLVEYNIQRTGINDYRPLAVVLEDANGSVVGGLWGRTVYGWLYVELLFVPEPLRGKGIGSELLLRAEAEAVRRGCHNSWLDTYEFQARGFYERLGYTCFGELAEYPAGYSRFFMKKELAPVSA